MANSILLTSPFSSSLHLPKPKIFHFQTSSSFTYATNPKPFIGQFPKPLKPICRKIQAIGETDGRISTVPEEGGLVGEDSAVFEFAKQKISSWVYFTGVLGVVLFVLDVVWIDNSTGFGKDFINAVSSISDSPEV